MTEREAELEAACGVMRAALERVAAWMEPGYRTGNPEWDADRDDVLAALAPSAGARAATCLTLVAEWERANREHYAYWQTQGYEREREEQLRERVHSVEIRLLEAARESSSEGRHG